MVKLICVTFGVPLERFFDMPQSYYCQCCSMPMPEPDLHGTEADGSPSQDFCRYCYDHGDFTAAGVTMDEFIEATAPMEAEALAPRLPTMEASMYCMAMDDSCAMMAGPLSRAVSCSCCPHVSFCPSRMSDRRKSVLPLFCSIQFCTLVSGVQR